MQGNLKSKFTWNSWEGRWGQKKIQPPPKKKCHICSYKDSVWQNILKILDSVYKYQKEDATIFWIFRLGENI